MRRREFLLGSAAANVLRGAARQPNIILILADDLGWGDLGCYGQEQIRTPNLDRLAREGLRFTQAYSGSTVCAPSRCCLMTGMHNGHGRLRDNLPHGVSLQPGDITVAEVLQRAGYRTGAFGKWHLGDSGTPGVPTRKGFDDFFGYRSGDHAHFYYPQTIWENDSEIILDGNRGGARKQYAPDLFAEKALEFIDRNKSRPFFLYLPTIIPHWSDYPADSVRSQEVPSDAPYSDRSWPQVEKNYAASVTRLDGQAGRIMEALRAAGIEQDTVVFFASDNGPSAEKLHSPRFFKSTPFRGVKRDMYDGGIRIPLLARWTGTIRPGQVSHHPCALWDFLPTAAELAGVRPPTGIDGISLLPTLHGRPQEPHEYMYWDYGHVRDKFLQAVRVGDWKGVRVGARAPIELYNLREDPGETRNLAVQYPQVAARLERTMAAARRESPDYPIRELGGK